MILTTVGYFIFFFLYLGIKDISFFSILTAFIIQSIYAVWFIEKQLKLQFIQMQQILTMNNEMTKVFNSLPEGIILFNKEN